MLTNHKRRSFCLTSSLVIFAGFTPTVSANAQQSIAIVVESVNDYGPGDQLIRVRTH
jgi:hypothetical protein